MPRKKPYSGKQKKLQLQEKRCKKNEHIRKDINLKTLKKYESEIDDEKVVEINYQPQKINDISNLGNSYDKNRFKLCYF